MFKIIYKESGISSFKKVNNLKKKLNIKKIGHTGTLDLLACGLLLVATDEDTKLISYIDDKTKEYKVICKLGFVSRTYDNEGPIQFVSDFQPSHDDVKKTLLNFVGNIKQKPPLFSAKKINGKKAYELARINKKVELKEIIVSIFSISNIKYNYPFLEFNTKVSNGTYIRSLVNDIGILLNTGAYVTYLERTRVNGLCIDDKIDIEKLLNISSLNVENINDIKKWFEGKVKKYDSNNGTFLLKYSEEIIGLVEIKNNLVVKTKLFGNRIRNIFDKN